MSSNNIEQLRERLRLTQQTQQKKAEQAQIVKQEEEKETKTLKASKYGTKGGKTHTNVHDAEKGLTEFLKDTNKINTTQAKNYTKIQANNNTQLATIINTVEGNTYKAGSGQSYYSLKDGTPITSGMVDQWKNDLAAGQTNLVLLNTAVKQGEANKPIYNKIIKQLEEESIKPHPEKAYTYKTSPTKLQIAEHKKIKKQTDAINKLIKSGVAKEENGQIVLTKDYKAFTDNQIKTAKTAGFDVSDKENLSFTVFEYGQKNLSKKNQKITEYTSVVLGQGEKVYSETIGALHSFVTGKPNTRNRSVTPETIGYTRNLSKQEEAYLTVGVIGSNYLANYAVAMPVGMVVGGVFKGASSIAKASGLKSPQAITKIAQEISKHPQLAQAIIYAPIAGIEAKTVYDAYKAGTPTETILMNEAMRVGTIMGQIQGLQSGFKVNAKIEEWYKTRGRNLIPPEELFRSVTLETGKLPTYEGKNRSSWSKEFKELAKKLSAEEYLGTVAPDEYRVWHGTESPFSLKKGETLTVLDGKSLNKFPGLFVAPEPSPLRLPSGASYTGESRLALPGLGGVSEIASIDALVEVMPSGMTRAQTQAWLNKQIGLKTAYIPPTSMITAEMEAIIPANSQLVKIGEEWYTNYAGHRVLVNQYILVAEGTTLSMLPKGAEFVKLSQLSSYSLPIETTYLAYGIIPPTITTTLSTSEIKALSKLYGVSESTIRKMVSSLSSTVSDIKTSTVTSSTVKLSDITSITGESDKTITGKTTTTPTPTTTPTITEIPDPSSPPDISAPLDPTPPLMLSKNDMSKRRDMDRKFYTGPKSIYRVTYHYSKTSKQTLPPIEARSILEATNKAQRAKEPNRKPWIMIDIEKVKG